MGLFKDILSSIIATALIAIYITSKKLIPMELIEKLDLEWLLNICAIFFIFAVYISIAAFRLDAKHKKEKANKGEFDHAIKQMSDPAIVSKLAGIDTLKRIALESPKEYLPILMDILTAFIKDMSPLSISASQPDLKTLPEEIQATLNVIGKHKNRYKKKSNINLSEVYLPRACMEGFDLRNMDLLQISWSRLRLKSYLINDFSRYSF